MARQKALPGLARAVRANVKAALREDIGKGDLTAALVPADQNAVAAVITREPAIICGQRWFDEVFAQVDPATTIRWLVTDGDRAVASQPLCKLEGRAASLLTGERTALNFLQTLSGITTLTAAYVDAVAGTGCRILDTRKTIPGLRLAQKYAVRAGGGTNHRIGLFDAMLVKENHIAAAGSIAAVVGNGRREHPRVMLEVEVENLDQLQQALDAGVDRVLLDNFSCDQLRQAVGLRDRHRHRVELEASGNIELATIRKVAETGVDYISVGALTKNVRAIDLSMRLRFGDQGPSGS